MVYLWMESWPYLQWYGREGCKLPRISLGPCPPHPLLFTACEIQGTPIVAVYCCQPRESIWWSPHNVNCWFCQNVDCWFCNGRIHLVTGITYLRFPDKTHWPKYALISSSLVLHCFSDPSMHWAAYLFVSVTRCWMMPVGIEKKHPVGYQVQKHLVQLVVQKASHPLVLN